MAKKKIIQAQQNDKNIPIEFFRIEDHVTLFAIDHHYQFDFYQIFWIKEAVDQQHIIDFVHYPLISNQIWILYPGQVQYFDATGIAGYYIVIDKDYFNRILFQEVKHNEFTGNGPLNFEVTLEKQDLFEYLHLLIELEWQGHARPKVLEKYLALYMVHIQDLPRHNTKHISIDLRIHRLLELIEEHYIEQRKNEFYADKIALSVKRMNEILIQSVGKSLKQQLQDRLLLEAKRLVGYSLVPIQEISNVLQFSDVSYFNRFFKQHTQFTPLDFRDYVKKVQV